MNVEDSKISLYCLEQYATCYHNRNYLEEELEATLQTYYENYVRTGYDPAFGLIPMGSSVEDATYMILKKKELYEKAKERFNERADLFELALEHLTDREREVIKIYYFAAPNTLGLSHEYFRKTLKNAQEKLCKYIGDIVYQRDLNKEKHFRQQLKEAGREKVRKWKESQKRTERKCQNYTNAY